MIDRIDETGIKDYLNENTKNLLQFQIFDCVESTNTLLKEQASVNSSGLTVIASKQTGGRGRLGRSFWVRLVCNYLYRTLRRCGQQFDLPDIIV